MTVKNGGTTIATYRYDGLHRRVQKITSATRDYYYSNKWQVVEERMNLAPACPERQFVWGLRYDDDLVMRDRVTLQSSSQTCQTADERLYVLHDFFHVAAVVNVSGTVVERYGFDAYGTVRFMDASFGARGSSNYGWETLYGAYRWDSETGLYQVRNRYLHPKVGVWLTRDPLDFADGLNLYYYVGDKPLTQVDSSGLLTPPQKPCPPKEEQCWGVGICGLIGEHIEDNHIPGDCNCPEGYFTLVCDYTCLLITVGPDCTPGVWIDYDYSTESAFCKTAEPPRCQRRTVIWGNFPDLPD